MIAFIKQYWKSIIWLFIILFLSTLQVPKIPGNRLINIPHFDKLVHFSLYFIGVSFWLFDYYKKKGLWNNIVFMVIISWGVLYGILMEVLQKVVVQNRSGDILDALANTVGVLTAFLLFRYSSWYRRSILSLLGFKNLN